MPPRKTPTSSVSGSHSAYFSSLRLTMITPPGVGLLANLIRYRIPAFTRWVYSGGPLPGTSPRRPPPITRLPLELIEEVIAYLTYDTYALRACTLTCYSWYIAAVPHLHQTLICPAGSLHEYRYAWFLSLIKRKNLGLLPLVKILWIRGDYIHRVALSLWPANWHILLPLFQLTSINQLRIDYPDISSFLPWIQSHRDFFPMLRGLALKNPKASRRELVYFIGFFQHLHDLTLSDWTEGLAGDPTLIPPFVPLLQGSLTMKRFKGANFLKDMIDLFGEFRFRHMDLFQVDGMRLLLGACGKTLESVAFDPTDPRGEQL